MSFTLTSPITGGAQTGFTSPTYTIAVDQAPNATVGKQYAVSAIGGTQTGVDATSSPARPFTITLSRPTNLRQLSGIDPATGQLRSVPRNVYKVLVRKGATVLAGQPASTIFLTSTLDIPAGADSADAANIRAALSLLIGALTSISASIGDTLVTGVI
jgi:hypothetical protein